MNARLVVVPLLALAATLTGCGSDAPGDDPVKSATGFLDELNDGNAAKACEFVAAETERKPVKKGSEEAANCEENIDALLNNVEGNSLDEWLDSDAEVDRDDDDATVAFTDVTAAYGVAEVDAEVSLIKAKADGKWYVVGATLFPAALASSP